MLVQTYPNFFGVDQVLSTIVYIALNLSELDIVQLLPKKRDQGPISSLIYDKLVLEKEKRRN